MPAPIYRFTDSTADAAEGDIATIMENIGTTLINIDSAVNALRDQWSASEADMYFNIIDNWSKGAKGLKDVLADINTALGEVQAGNTALRNSISGILDSTE